MAKHISDRNFIIGEYRMEERQFNKRMTENPDSRVHGPKHDKTKQSKNKQTDKKNLHSVGLNQDKQK